MNQVKLILGLSLISVGTSFAQQIPAQQTTQPVQQTTQQVNTPNNSRLYQNGQVPKTANVPQQIGNLPQTVQTTQTTTTVPQGTVDGQETVPATMLNEDGTPIVIDGQTQTTTEVSTQTTETTPGLTQPANNGMVPKVYINTEEQLPFRQYQPKPTGQISPSTNQSNVPTRRRP